MSKIPLIKNTIDEKDIQSLIEWLQTNPRLTKGELTEEFERRWSEWMGVKYSIYVNSGSSANLAIIYALKLLSDFRNNNIVSYGMHYFKTLKKVVVPAVSWVTTVSPMIQLGVETILCEVDKKTLSVDLSAFEEICKRENPSHLLMVHVLGIPAEMDDLIHLCKKYDVILLEDSCESVGSTFKEKKTGSFGLASSFSFYYGHHMSTIEGGMVCTNDTALCNMIRSIRAHGWDRDILDEDTKSRAKENWDVDDFKSLYTFYFPGFNLRSTDLQAFIGLQQMNKLDEIVKRRNEVLNLYDKMIQNDYWKLDINRKDCFISNFAYPIITNKIEKVVKSLNDANIETRPLICGSIGKQPFWEIYNKGSTSFLFADKIHKYGLYLPNNHQITDEEVKTICNVINGALK